MYLLRWVVSCLRLQPITSDILRTSFFSNLNSLKHVREGIALNSSSKRIYLTILLSSRNIWSSARFWYHRSDIEKELEVVNLFLSVILPSRLVKAVTIFWYGSSQTVARSPSETLELACAESCSVAVISSRFYFLNFFHLRWHQKLTLKTDVGYSEICLHNEVFASKLLLLKPTNIDSNFEWAFKDHWNLSRKGAFRAFTSACPPTGSRTKFPGYQWQHDQRQG